MKCNGGSYAGFIVVNGEGVLLSQNKVQCCTCGAILDKKTALYGDGQHEKPKASKPKKRTMIVPPLVDMVISGAQIRYID